MLRLKLVKGPDKVGEKWKLKLDTSWTIGRSESSDIRLTKGAVSKRHCSLRLISENELEIEDLNSSNGTFVNGVLIKKHICEAGDIIKISSYEIKVSKDMPEFKAANKVPSFASSRPAAGTNVTSANLALRTEPWMQNQFTPQNELNMRAANPTPNYETDAPPVSQDIGSTSERWIERNIYPVADYLSQRINVRTLLVIFFVLWSVMMIALTAYPFMDKANQRVQAQAIEVGKLYARQLVRVNQNAIVEQRYSSLIGALDSKNGQTPGLIESMILDNQKAQILAPTDKLGLGVPGPFAAKAIAAEKEFVSIDQAGRAHIGIPIYVGTSEGNVAVATAYVILNIDRAVFNTANLLDQITSSLLIGLILGGILLIFAYRWVEGSIKKLSTNVNQALRDPSMTLEVPAKWNVLSELSAEISAILAKASLNQGASQDNFSGSSNTSAWLNDFVLSIPFAAAVMDADQKITSWNAAMESLSGIRSSQAMGSEISGASRDMAFETAIRELCVEAQNQIAIKVERSLDFSGTNHKIGVIFTGFQFFISIIQDAGT